MNALLPLEQVSNPPLSKLRVPTLVGFAAARPRLLVTWPIESSKLILIHGPAGAGKTTLALQCLATWTDQVAWLSLEASDNHAAQFARCLILSFAQAHSDIGAITPSLGGGDLENLEPVLSALISMLESKPPLILVLDDAHVISTQNVLAGIRFLIDHLPSHVKLIMMSRVVPDIGVASLRVKRLLREIDARDLCFTSDEAHDFFVNQLPFEPELEDSARAVKQTEGWAAGLNILALVAARRGALQLLRHPPADLRQYLWDFFAEEVFERQSEDLRNFLFATGVLDQFDADLAGDVALCVNPHEYVQRVKHANLFLVSVDDGERWYRYHQLFAEFLCHRVQHVNKTLACELHLRASRAWFARGRIVEATRHAVVAQSVAAVFEILQTQAWLLFRHHKALMVQCLALLPQEAVACSLSLMQIQAWLYLEREEFDRVESLLKAVETQQLPEVELDQRNRILGCLACVRAQMAEIREDIPLLRKALDVAKACLPAEDAGWLTVSLLSASLALRDGCALDAEREYRSAIRAAHRLRDYSAIMWSYSRLGGIVYLLGNVVGGKSVWLEAVSVATDIGILGEHNLLFIYLGLVDACRELYDREGSDFYLVRAQALADQMGARWSLPVQVARVRCRLTFSQEIAESCVREIMRALLSVDANSYDISQADEACVGWWITMGDVDALRAWLRGKTQVTVTSDPPSHMTARAVARAQIYAGEIQAAVEILQQAVSLARDLGYSVILMRNLILLSVAWVRMKRLQEACQAFTEAITLGVSNGAVGSFMALRPDWELLLSMELVSDELTLRQFAQRLRDLSRPRSRRAAKHEQPLPAAVRAVPLTAREWEILQLIGDGLSNEEIAEKLFVDLTTVKSHIKSAYRKAGVSSRARAIRFVQALQQRIVQMI
jgi:LuxR family transcriptional regulator, maltose regulon positive regulatory protein